MGNFNDLHQRLFRGLLLAADIEERVDRGEIPRAQNPFGMKSLLGDMSEAFVGDLVDRAERMAFAYGLMYCFENAVRDLVGQRLLERLGPDWWTKVPEK